MPAVPNRAITASQSSQLILLMVFRLLFVYILAKNLKATTIAATDKRMMETASKAGPLLAVELESWTLPHAVPGVLAPKLTAAEVAAGETVPVSCDVVGPVAVLAEVMDREGGAVHVEAVAGAVDAEASTLGQKVLLKACISVQVTSAPRALVNCTAAYSECLVESM